MCSFSFFSLFPSLSYPDAFTPTFQKHHITLVSWEFHSVQKFISRYSHGKITLTLLVKVITVSCHRELRRNRKCVLIIDRQINIQIDTWGDARRGEWVGRVWFTNEWFFCFVHVQLRKVPSASSLCEKWSVAVSCGRSESFNMNISSKCVCVCSCRMGLVELHKDGGKILLFLSLSWARLSMKISRC